MKTDIDVYKPTYSELLLAFTDDGEAFRLAAKYQLNLSLGHGGAIASTMNGVQFSRFCHPDSNEHMQCARSAIVECVEYILGEKV